MARPIALVLLLFGLVCGCEEKDERQVIKFWAMGREAEIVAQLVPEFERENPDLKIEIQQIPWASAHEKLLTAFVADGLPDLCPLGNTWIPEFAALNALEPLQSYVAHSSVVDARDYFPGVWDINRIDGTLYGVSWYVDTRLLFYRRDLLAEVGYSEPPQDWQEWETMMAALREAGAPERYAILLPVNEFEQLLSFALQQPDEVLRDGDRFGNFESPGFRKALAFYHNMFVQEWAPSISETQISNVWDEFGKGLFTFYVSGPWNIREFRQRLPAALQTQWMTAPLPGPNGPGAGIAGGTSLVVFRSSRQKDGAWRLIEFLSRPDIQRRFYMLIGNLPPRRSSWDDPVLADDVYARAFREQLERVKPTPKVLEWEQIAQEIRLMSERVIRGGEDPDRALVDLNRKADAILEKRRWILERDTVDTESER